VVQCGAVWCSVVQCGAVWCSVVQCDTVWCSALRRCSALCDAYPLAWHTCCSELQWVAVSCSELQWPAVCCSVRCVMCHATVEVTCHKTKPRKAKQNKTIREVGYPARGAPRSCQMCLLAKSKPAKGWVMAHIWRSNVTNTKQNHTEQNEGGRFVVGKCVCSRRDESWHTDKELMSQTQKQNHTKQNHTKKNTGVLLVVGKYLCSQKDESWHTVAKRVISHVHKNTYTQICMHYLYLYIHILKSRIEIPRQGCCENLKNIFARQEIHHGTHVQK